jgi:hypothetical protein
MILQFKKYGFVALHLAPYLTYTRSKIKGDANRGMVDSYNQNLLFSFYNYPEFTLGYRF